jgi:hypothetical protein
MTQTQYPQQRMLGADTGSHTVHKRQRNDERQHIALVGRLDFLAWVLAKALRHATRYRHASQRPLAEVKPIRDDLEQPFGDTTDTKQYASPKQRGMIRARAFEKKIGTSDLMPYINKLLGNQYSSIEALSKQEASQVIESLGN